MALFGAVPANVTSLGELLTGRAFRLPGEPGLMFCGCRFPLDLESLC